MILLGDKMSPILLLFMITEAHIHKILEGITEGTELFLVDIRLKPGNKIFVEIDKNTGITVDECGIISKQVEQLLDRDIEDYELNVSSPGLTRPFKVPEQYKKNIGKKIEVLKKNGVKKEGILKMADKNGIILETGINKKLENSIEENIKLDEIKSANVVITF